MHIRFTSFGPLLVALVAAGPSYAQQVAVDSPLATLPAAAEAGQRAAIDPQTGRLRGLTPEEARSLVESLIGSLNQSDTGLVPVVLPNGARAVDLQGRFEAASLAKVDVDGTIATECVTTKEEADHFLNGPSAEAPAGADLLEEK
jgi:hypothetical protein